MGTFLLAIIRGISALCKDFLLNRIFSKKCFFFNPMNLIISEDIKAAAIKMALSISKFSAWT